MPEHHTNDSNESRIGRTIPLPVVESTDQGQGNATDSTAGSGNMFRKVSNVVTGQKSGGCGSDGCAPQMGRTKIARWRAGVLIMVNVLMIAHLIQWLIAGMTISPIEPSEAMETLEVGVINAGAILFVLAFLSTLILGRFFCGWLCHVVALQDLCAYLMIKIGIRPKPFRSRLLVYFPFALGMYMFVWPTFKRVALAPALKSLEVDWPAWLRRVEPIHQWSTGLVVDDFWATMPPWYIAVPFLFICGFACVYVLGAKGFCTYGCPYAAFFKPMDTLAPVRVHVNDDCHQCGYCTSVCTSNVRVSEEVRDFGMVVDPGCMKTLDCISACPNDALSLGIGKPALLAKPTSPETYKKAKTKRAGRYDMNMKEELLAAVLLLWFFFATRGMLDAVPMLMAGGLAAIAVYMVMTSIKIFTNKNARLYKYQLKARSKIKPAGYVIILLGIFFVIGSAWSGHARTMRWYGDLKFAQSHVPTTVMFRPEFMASEQMRVSAQQAVDAYTRGDSMERGGIGWNLNPEHRLRLSYFYGMLGNLDESLEQLMIVIREGSPTDSLVLQAGQLVNQAVAKNPPEGMDASHIPIEQRERMLEIYQEALDVHPNLHAIRAELARAAISVGDQDRANALWAIKDFQDDPMFHIARARYIGFSGDMNATREALETARDLARTLDRPAGPQIDVARTALQYYMNDLALEIASEAIEGHSATALTWLAAGEIANASGQGELGSERALVALDMPGVDRPMVQARAAGVLAKPGNTDRARELLADAARRSEDPYEKIFIAQGMARAGLGLEDDSMYEQAMFFFKEAADEYPDHGILQHDYASMLYQANKPEEAAAAMGELAEREAKNPIFAQRASQLYMTAGNQERGLFWQGEYERRMNALQNATD